MNGNTVPRGSLRQKQTRFLGPVHNMEQYVQADWWKSLFNSLYLMTDSDVVEDNEITAAEVDLFAEILDVKPKDSILDLCCGQGRHSLELRRRGFANIHGMDRSRFLIQKARSRAKKECLDVLFREGDAKKVPFKTDTFSYVLLLGNSFGYFETIQEDLAVLREVSRVLTPKGKLLIDVTDGDYIRENFEPRSWEWISKNHFVCRERTLSLDGQRLIAREIINHTARGVLADQFYAERIYTQPRLEELLNKAGFSEIRFHQALESNSKRAQDLGMMARRLILTASIYKNWSSVRIPSRQLKRSITVIMGDPCRPDSVKPNGKFEETDLLTIHHLKEALTFLSREQGYKFQFLNAHNTLIQDLMALKIKKGTDLVLNLCDEGYMNDPCQELHVPALLEMLKIPYTGSNPQCLAHCYDKSLIRGLAEEMNIPVPKALLVKPEDSIFTMDIPFPVIVKPNFGDSSFGITKDSVCANADELTAIIARIRNTFGYDKPVLIEEFLTGKDITVGIIGNIPSDYRVLPIVEEDYSRLPAGLPKICGYEAKWLQDSLYWAALSSKPADLPKQTEKKLTEWCLYLIERVDCRDYTRLDWRLDSKGLPRLLEINPNPGWCWDGHLAKMAALDGLEYKDMLCSILKAAEIRIGLLDIEVEKDNKIAEKEFS